MADFVVTYAQNREDIYLSGFFKDIKDGLYVDVGANHPSIFSVTKKFYLEGWRGINIEPIKSMYKLLEIERPEDINLPVGISSKKGSLSLREYKDGDGLSTLSSKVKKIYAEEQFEITKRYVDYDVPVMRLSDVFEKYVKTDINFMKVDVEGYEYEVLESNDWKKYRPQVLCIESIHIVKDWRPLLKDYGYDFAFSDGINNYYVANEHHQLIDNYSYPETMLAKIPITNEFYGQMKILKQQLSQTDQRVIRQELVSQGLAMEIANLNAQIENNKRIRSVVKQLARGLHLAIITQIEKLNKPHIKKQPPLIIKNPESAKEILSQIEAYDLKRYRKSKPEEPLAYRLVIETYLGLARLLKRLVKYVAKVIRGSNDK